MRETLKEIRERIRERESEKENQRDNQRQIYMIEFLNKSSQKINVLS